MAIEKEENLLTAVEIYLFFLPKYLKMCYFCNQIFEKL